MDGLAFKMGEAPSMLHMASVLQGASESQQAREHSVGAVWQLRYLHKGSRVWPLL